MALKSGYYDIINFGDGPVGIASPVPPVQPVVPVNPAQVWLVKHVTGDQYLLDIDGNVTVASGGFVEAIRFPVVKGTIWVIKPYSPGHYTIIDLRSERNGWTLKPKVLLEPVPPTNVKPPQLWLFRFLRPTEEGEEN